MGQYPEIAFFLCALVGLSLGLLGGGGSILAVPVLVFVAGVAPRAAVGMSLAIVGSTALLAGLLHRRSGQVDFRVAAAFGVTGMLGAFLGGRLTDLVSESTLLLLFAGLMFLVGGWMLYGVTDRIRGHGTEEQQRPSRAGAVLTAGFAVGVLTGFLGVGGGFLIVPALVLFSGLSIKQAIGTSLIVIAANSAAGFASHLEDGGLDVAQTLAFTAAAVVGAFGGHWIASRTAPQRLRRGFAAFVMVIGCLVAVQTLTTIG